VEFLDERTNEFNQTILSFVQKHAKNSNALNKKY
jgi:hypothetical protein